jgi:hypothetical protein
MVLTLFLVESLPPLTQAAHTPALRGSLYVTLTSLVLIFLLTLERQRQRTCNALRVLVESMLSCSEKRGWNLYARALDATLKTCMRS